MEFYRFTGRSGLWGVPVATFYGALAVGILAPTYVLLNNLNRVVYVNILLTLVLGYVVGFAVADGAKFGKMRNSKLTTILGALTGLVAVYVAWACDPMARLEHVHWPVWSLDALSAYMRLGYEEGFWSLSSLTTDPTREAEKGELVAGMSLATVWVVEAIVIVGLASWAAACRCTSQPFCEACDAWTVVKHVKRQLLPHGSTERLLERLIQQGDMNLLADFFRADGDEPSTLRLATYTCPHCTDSNYLSIDLITRTLNEMTDDRVLRMREERLRKLNKQVRTENLPASRRKYKEAAVPLLRYLRITHDELSIIRNPGQDPPAAQEAPAPDDSQPDAFSEA